MNIRSHTMKPNLASTLFLIVLSAFSALAQTHPRQVKLNSDWKPYEWPMMPAADFFKLTGLSESDSVSYRTYRIGTDTIGSVKVYMEYILETNSDVVGVVKYENIKVKDLFKLDKEIDQKYHLDYGDPEDMPFYFSEDALVQFNYLDAATLKKRAHLEIYASPLYEFVPQVEHVLDKLDSTWSQLINNPTGSMRGIVNDSGTYRVTIKDVSPMIEYEIVYPALKSERPYAMTSTTIDGGLKALKWAMKKYYTEYVDHIDAGEIWAAPSDGPLVKVAFFFDDGVILHDTWPYEEYIEWMTYDEDE